MQMVQYRGGGPAMAAVISGEAHMAVDPTASATSHIRAGTVRPIAISGSQRVASLPEIPAATEAGLPAWSGAAWIGAFAPAQTPRSIVESLNVTFNAAMERIKPRLVDVGIEIEPQYATIAAFSAYVREEFARSAAVLRTAGVKPE
jgi:tripartite-type tricarboxylate transporter receptor subunit TctC